MANHRASGMFTFGVRWHRDLLTGILLWSLSALGLSLPVSCYERVWTTERNATKEVPTNGAGGLQTLVQGVHGIGGTSLFLTATEQTSPQSDSSDVAVTSYLGSNDSVPSDPGSVLPERYNNLDWDQSTSEVTTEGQRFRDSVRGLAKFHYRLDDKAGSQWHADVGEALEHWMRGAIGFLFDTWHLHLTLMVVGALLLFVLGRNVDWVRLFRRPEVTPSDNQARGTAPPEFSGKGSAFDQPLPSDAQRSALRRLYIEYLQRLEQQHLISAPHHKTREDILRQIDDPKLRADFALASVEVERVVFGARDLTASEYSRVMQILSVQSPGESL